MFYGVLIDGRSNNTVVTSFLLEQTIGESGNLLQTLWSGFVKHEICSHFWGFVRCFSVIIWIGSVFCTLFNQKKYELSVGVAIYFLLFFFLLHDLHVGGRRQGIYPGFCNESLIICSDLLISKELFYQKKMLKRHFAEE